MNRAERGARWIRRGIAAGLLAFATFVGIRDMAAQTPAPKQDLYGSISADEREAIELLQEDKMLTARTKAEELLKKDPDSFVGHYVMGTALREAEGALARSLAHLKRAREIYEVRYAGDTSDGRPWRVYADTIFGIMNTTELMENFEDSLRAMDDYDAQFQPKLYAQRVWPLMKLGRYDDARAWAQRAIDSGSPYQKMRAMNGLCAVEGEQQHRVANYDACLAVYKYAKQRLADTHETDPARMPAIVVYANNAHLGALAVLKYDEAEQLALDGTRSREQTSSNPWLRLARIYMDQGRAAEALSATKALEGWRVQQPPSTREQFSAEDEGTVALLLLVAGEAKAALVLADRILARPDRRAMTSTHPEQTAGANALLRRSITLLASELASERASYGGIKAAPGHLAESAKLAAAAWPDAQRVVGSLLDEERLINTLRVYIDGGIEYVPTWMIGDLVDVLGPGVFLAALGEVRAREKEVDGFSAFYDAFEAEARLAQGDDGMALLLAKKALQTLPKAEVLLKARTAVIGAEAARRQDDLVASLGFFEQAMQSDPGVIRRMGLRLPVRFRVSGSERANDTVSLLRKSPRFREEEQGFVVSVGDDGKEITMCLRTPLDAELGCTHVPVVLPTPPEAAPAPAAKEGETPSKQGVAAPRKAPPEAPERAAEAFHKDVFALKMNLSESDLQSLDGGTTATRDAAREKMRELLGDEATPPEAPVPQKK
jgi:tetratricopeptide (TPR) repeat protein